MKKHDNEVGLISYTYEIMFKMYVLKSLKNMILTGCENVEDGMKAVSQQDEKKEEKTQPSVEPKQGRNREKATNTFYILRKKQT